MNLDAQIIYFSRNGQCAAGSGAFWYQQATRMGYNDREAVSAGMARALVENVFTSVSQNRISGPGRCPSAGFYLNNICGFYCLGSAFIGVEVDQACGAVTAQGDAAVGTVTAVV